MKSLKLLIVVAIAGALSLTQGVRADDTEIFTAPPPLSGSAGNPNVLIIIDNSANWDANNQHWADNCPGQTSSKQGDAELCALSQIAGSLPPSVNVGLMLFTAGASTTYVRYAMRPMNAAVVTAMAEINGTATSTNGPVGSPGAVNSADAPRMNVTRPATVRSP